MTSNARRLRQSSDDFIRQNVFINTNLTRAESKAAYELRCRRRAAANARMNEPSPVINSTPTATAAAESSHDTAINNALTTSNVGTITAPTTAISPAPAPTTTCTPADAAAAAIQSPSSSLSTSAPVFVPTTM